MEASILKIISDAGLGMGAVVALVVVVVYQLRYMEKMGKSIEENTLATKALGDLIRQSIETDKEVVRTIEHCKNKA